ncbi:23S rRNA (adenine(2030)-N(6))-methyltransferase RlmJ [Klebsiella pneumoniae]|uniref:23S rRNA (adenine(2030)-N(6))-methyltransferase RlmJ n=1 Tax=Klebsiella pneumoniae TaxID=573 RepID=UPI0022283540|nr:23S rRNA (adenine(2030)-N(6))-methyltransferase RlmJ [Klebsiella pneumoniae]
MDTHAGAGRYQLSGEHAERTASILKASPASAAGRPAGRAGAVYFGRRTLQP